MPAFAAFLRAVNVGRRKAPMADVRQCLTDAGFTEVSTLLNSGNVVLRTPTRSAAAVERAVEKALAELLGFEVETFVRTRRQLEAIAGRDAFDGLAPGPGDSVHVGFLKRAPVVPARERVAAMSGDRDVLRIHGTELHWLIHGRMSDSALPPGGFERALGGPTAITLRNLKTVHRLVASDALT